MRVALTRDEVVLVEVAAPRQHFALRLSNVRLVYTREGVRGGDTTECSLDGITKVTLTRILPWLSWGFAAAVALAFVVWLVACLTGAAVFRAEMLVVPAGAAFFFASGAVRWRLSFTSVGRRYAIVQPYTSNIAARAAISRAIRETYALLTDDAARDRGIREKLVARPDPLVEAGATDDDRQLCPDGACTGLLGADGRCKVCGRAGS